MSARCMPQPGRNKPSKRRLRRRCGRCACPRVGVGADRQIAARAVVDAAAGDQAFGAQIGRRRRRLRSTSGSARPAPAAASARSNSCRAAPSCGRAGPRRDWCRRRSFPARRDSRTSRPAAARLLSRKLTQLITQPVCPREAHSGVDLNVPPTRLPCGHQHVVAGDDRADASGWRPACPRSRA